MKRALSVCVGVALLAATLIATAATASATTFCGAGELLGAAQLLSTAGTTITFSSIAQHGGGNCTYSNLMVTGQARSDTTTCDPQLQVQVNNDTAGDYSYDEGYWGGNGFGEIGGAQRTFWQLQQISCNSGVTGNAAVFKLIFPDFTTTTFDHQVTAAGTNGNRGNYNGATNWHSAGTWAQSSTPAGITRLDLTLSSGSFMSGSQFSLYLE